jgi:hypothetical protein
MKFLRPMRLGKYSCVFFWSVKVNSNSLFWIFRTPYAVASQTLDSVAIHLPPTKFMPIIMAHIQPALDSSDVDQLRGINKLCHLKT